MKRYLLAVVFAVATLTGCTGKAPPAAAKPVYSAAEGWSKGSLVVVVGSEVVTFEIWVNPAVDYREWPVKIVDVSPLEREGLEL